MFPYLLKHIIFSITLQESPSNYGTFVKLLPLDSVTQLSNLCSAGRPDGLYSALDQFRLYIWASIGNTWQVALTVARGFFLIFRLVTLRSSGLLIKKMACLQRNGFLSKCGL